MVSVSTVNPIQWFNTVACVTGWSFGLKNPASVILTASVFGDPASCREWTSLLYNYYHRLCDQMLQSVCSVCFVCTERD